MMMVRRSQLFLAISDNSLAFSGSSLIFEFFVTNEDS